MWTHTHTHTHIYIVLFPLPPAVIAELDDVVLVAVLLCVHYKTEERLLLLLPLDLHPAPEEPVTTVLAGTPGFKANMREWKTQEQKTDRAEQHAQHKAVLLICRRTPPVGLSQVKTLHTGGVPFNPLEHRRVEVQIPGVKGQTFVKNMHYEILTSKTNRRGWKVVSCAHSNSTAHNNPQSYVRVFKRWTPPATKGLDTNTLFLPDTF